jgi:hypothetical protein
VAWWGWVLIGWVVLAAVVAVVVGLGIRAADRRELGQDGPEDASDDADEDGA